MAESGAFGHSVHMAPGPGRLDAILNRLTPGVSRSQLQKWIRAGLVDVDGHTVTRPSRAVLAGSEILLRAAEPAPAVLEPQAVPFTLLYRDQDVAVVDKPAGVVVHPGEQNEQGTLVHGLLGTFPDLAAGFSEQDQRRPGIEHRLDRGTSGLLVVALNASSRLALVEQFQSRSVQKTYLAWVFGVTPASGTWSGAIGRHPRDRKRFAVVAGGKPARTDYRALVARGRSTKLEIDLKTGRTHQIRVHASTAGFPLLGDPVYRKRGKVPAALVDWGPERDRPALHAWRLAFSHPRTGKQLDFEAPLPDDLKDLDRRDATD